MTWAPLGYGGRRTVFSRRIEFLWPSAGVVAGFVDSSVNRLLDLENRQEAALVLVPVGFVPEPSIGSSSDLEPLSLDTQPISEHEVELPAIWEMHGASSLTDEAEVVSWRGEGPAMLMPHPSGRLVPLNRYSDGAQRRPRTPSSRSSFGAGPHAVSATNR